MLGFNLSVGRNRQSIGDADAQAFITATGLTGTTETTAVRRLVSNLKTYGLWSKMKAIYPFVSDTVNLLSYSEDFTNVTWGKPNISATANTTIAPDGTLTADTIQNNGSGYITQSNIALSSGTYTQSIYAKKNNNNWVAIYTSDQGSNYAVAWFNLNTGVKGTVSAVGTFSSATSTMTAEANGFYRCSITFTKPTTAATDSALIVPDGDNTFTRTIGQNAYIWGAQFQTSSLTTYQPIATTPANRFVSQFKYNLKDPRDLDAAFRLAFNGTWAYSKQGATPNGVNGYANTYLNPVAQGLTTASAHLSYYARTQASTSEPCEMGNYTSSSIGFTLHSKSSLGTSLYYYSNTYAASYPVAVAPTGLLSGSSIANTRRDLYFNGVSVANNTTTDNASLGNYNAFIGACNYDNSTAVSFSNAQTGFSSIGQGLTSTEMANLYTSVQQFNQDLSRQVGVPIVSDADAQSFLNAAQITDLTQANAINTLVVGLKNASLWTKMKAIYPFVGGTATSHKWNLKDPRDLDAAYRLAFFGAWNHSSTGALPNGVNAYADTKFIPNTALTLNSAHLSFYSRTNNITGIDDFSSVVVGDTQNMRLIINLTGSLYADLNSVNQRITYANTSSTGLYQVSRTSSTSLKVYKNNTIVATNTSANTGTQPIISMYLGAANRAGGTVNYSNRECAFASLGDGLNDTEATTLNTLVTNFETTLGRNV